MKKLLFLFYMFSALLYGFIGIGGGSSKPKINIDADASEQEHVGYITFKAKLDGDANDTWWFKISTEDDTAKAGDDYEGQNSKKYTCSKDVKECEFNVTIYDDDDKENDETFKVKIVDHSENVDDGDNLERKGTIENDDTNDNSGSADLIVDDDGKDCSDANYTKITDALKDAKDGDVIKVCKGEYSDSLDVTKAVTIEGDLNTNRDDIKITSQVRVKKSGVTLKHLFIDYTYEGVKIEDNSIDTNLIDLHVKSTNSHPVYLNKAHNVYIKDSFLETSASGGYAIYSSVINLLDINNTIINSEGLGIGFGNDDGENLVVKNTQINSKKQAIFMKYVNDANISNVKINANHDGIVFGDEEGHNLIVSNSEINISSQHGIWINNANDVNITDTNVTSDTYESLVFGCESGNNLYVENSIFYKEENSKDPSNFTIVRGKALIKDSKIIDKETTGLLISLNNSLGNCDTNEKVEKVDIINTEINTTKKEAIFAHNVKELNIRESFTYAKNADYGGVYVESADSINFYHNKFNSDDNIYALYIEDVSDSSKIIKNKFNDGFNGKDFYSENKKKTNITEKK